MKHTLKLLTLMLLLEISPVMAKLLQSIDRDEISAGETFVLDIKIDEETDASPDLSMIPADITIVSNSQYQHTQLVNGRRSTVIGWKLKLKTLKPGRITIPAIPVGDQATQPIHLNIKESSYRVDINGQKGAIFLTAEVDQKDPYVQQQIIYTVSLYRSVATHYENLSAPVVENSIIEKLGDDAVFEEIINNKRYTVYQRKYVVFPQQSGKIEIGPVNFTADVNDSSRRSRSLFLNSTRPISVSTQPIDLQVKPKPANAKDPWLPAENVVLADRWSNNSRQLKVGEPVTLTILLTMQGLSESQLPELQIPKIDGLQVYPDAPQKERQVNEKGILGQRVEKFAVIPAKEGSLTIPSIELAWWDTKNNSQKIAKLPSRTFNVVAGEVTSQPPINIPTLPEPLAEIPTADNTNIRQWQMAAAGLLALWLLTLFAYFNKLGKSSKGSSASKDKTPPKMHESQKQALASARKSLKSSSPAEIENAILSMTNSLGQAQYHSLGAVAQKISDQALVEKLSSLEKRRYSALQQSDPIEIKNNDLDQIIKEISYLPDNTSNGAIPPLYSR